MDNKDSNSTDGTLETYYQSTLNNLKTGFISTTDNAASQFKSAVNYYLSKLKGYVISDLNSIRDYSNTTLYSVLDYLYFFELVENRQSFLQTWPLSYRVLAVALPNFPLLIFSKGRARLRNPFVFTFTASFLIAPELINPFNRR